MPLTETRAALRVYSRLPARLQLLAKRLLTPSYTLGAVVVLRRPDGALLLVCQSYRPGWALPGGIVARGEEPHVAARRELAEELAVDLPVAGEPRVVIDVATQEIDCVYLLDVPADLPVSPRSPEIARAEWFDPSMLPPMQPEALRALRRAGVSGS